MPERKVIHGAMTAIKRTRPPEPMRWLHDRNLIKGRVLDYGSGRHRWYGMDAYDPYWRPKRPTGHYDAIVCNYVLNVVPLAVQKTVLAKIRRLLAPCGTADVSDVADDGDASVVDGSSEQGSGRRSTNRKTNRRGPGPDETGVQRLTTF